jgi:origin recognition complex subunit 5
MEGSISGYDDFVLEFQTLISTYPPPFIYVYDPISLRKTSTVLTAAITSARSDLSHSADVPDIYHVHLDAVTCFTQRLLFDTILSSLSIINLDSDSSERWNDSWDSFLHGLRHFRSQRRQELSKDVRFIFSIEQAHRLKEKLPDSIIPLSRLSELVSVFLVVASTLNSWILESTRHYCRLHVADSMARS